jgi:hypothetical protein
MSNEGILIVYESLRTDPEELSILDLFDRILEKGIVFDPWARVALAGIDFCRSPDRIVVAPERRRFPFIVPTATPNRSTRQAEPEQAEREQRRFKVIDGFRRKFTTYRHR